MAKSQTQRHTLEGQNLEVKPYYPFLQDTTTKKTEIPFDLKEYNIFRWVMAEGFNGNGVNRQPSNSEKSQITNISKMISPLGVSQIVLCF